MFARHARAFIIAAILAVAGFMAAPAALAGQIITVTASGRITSSTDSGLLGQSASVVQRFHVASGTLLPGTPTSYGLFGTLGIDIIIDGLSSGFESNTAVSAFGFYAVSTGDLPNSEPATIGAQSSVEIAPGIFVGATAIIASYAEAFVASSDLLQDFSFPPMPAGAALSFGFSMEDTDGNVFISFSAEDVDGFTVAVTTVTIPTPAALGIFAFALLGLVVVRRHVPAVRQAASI